MSQDQKQFYKKNLKYAHGLTSAPSSSQTRNIYKWWAQYLESQSDMDSALDFYDLAQDYLSLVRVHCYMGNIQEVVK